MTIAHNYNQLTGTPPTTYDYNTQLRYTFWDEFDALGQYAASQPADTADHYSKVGAATALSVLEDAGDAYVRVGGASTAVGVDQGLVTRIARTFVYTQNPRFKVVISRGTASVGGTVELLAGFVDQTAPGTTGQQNGVYFRSVNGANWFLVCRAAGVETTRDMGIAPSTTRIMLEFIMSSSGTSVQGYLNSVLTSTAITTNIPTPYMSAVVRVDNRAATVTTAAILRVDGWGWYGDR
jgi:hypothetical protein